MHVILFSYIFSNQCVTVLYFPQLYFIVTRMENIAHLNALWKIEHSFRFDLANAKYFL